MVVRVPKRDWGDWDPVGMNSLHSWFLMQKLSGGGGFFEYLLRQPAQMLIFPAILQTVNG